MYRQHALAHGVERGALLCARRHLDGINHSRIFGEIVPHRQETERGKNRQQ